MNMSQEQKKMPSQDEWGRDPAVQSMRRIFSSMEEAQRELLLCLNISVLDRRLRRSREQALELFERTWPKAARRGIMGEEGATSLYLHCLAESLRLAGVDVPEELLPRNEKVIHLLKKESI
jgi:hypothetical protein